jgi:hypothetical protein
LRAEHERVLAERDRLAEEMERMAEPIKQIVRTVRRIETCDREIGRLNAISALRFGYIRPVLSGAAPAVATLFQDAVCFRTPWSGMRSLRSQGCMRRQSRRGRRTGTEVLICAGGGLFEE